MGSSPTSERMRALEAKDVALHDAPAYDVGAALGNRRAAFVTAVALVGALAIALTLSIGLVAQVMLNRYVAVPVVEMGNGTLAIGADYLVADSVLYRPEEVADFAKDFVNLRYQYDYRLGVAQLLAARAVIPKGYAEGLFPSRDQIDRLDAQQTIVTLRYDSTAVRTFPQGRFEVTLLGHKVLQNIQYSSTLGARTTPFKEIILLGKVARTPDFRHSLAVYGAKGDLDP